MAFSDKMFDMVNKGMAASRAIVAKASSQAHVWGEMGVLKVEVVQMRAQAEKLTAKLGAEVYAAFAERKETSVSSDKAVIKDLIGRIADLGRAIEEKEAAFKKLGGNESDLDQGSDI
jgi:hypothetical protein